MYSGEYEEISSGLGVKYSAFHFQTWLNLSVWPNKQSIILCLYEMHMLKSLSLSTHPKKKCWVYIGWWCHYVIHTVMMTDLAQLNSIKGLCWCVFVYYNIGKVNECLKGISLRIIFRNFFFLDGLEIFYGKMIK